MQTFKQIVILTKKEKIATTAVSLCKLLGYNPQWYRTWEENPAGQKAQAQERFMQTLNLLIENKQLQHKLSLCEMQQYDCIEEIGAFLYKIEYIKKGENFITSFTSNTKSQIKAFGKEVLELDGLESYLYKKALDRVVLQYKIDYSSIEGLTIIRVDTIKEREMLDRELLFI